MTNREKKQEGRCVMSLSGTKVYVIETQDGELYQNPTSGTRFYTSKKKRDNVLENQWHQRDALKNGLVLIPKTYVLSEVVEDE